MLTRYADDWVAVWNGSRDRAEEIKAEIKAFLANVLKLKLSEEKTLITHIDDGFQFWAIKFRVTNAGQMDSGARVPKAIDAAMPSRQLPKTRSPMKWLSLPQWFDSGLGNYYAYAADSRLMDSLDAFIYQEVGSIAYIKAEDGQNQPTAGTRCLVTFAKSVT